MIKSESRRCHICGHIRKLTDDHVPPKNCMTLEKVDVQSLLSVILGNNIVYDNHKLKQQFQNGIKYNTICEECNSKLGLYYDKTLGKFINDLTDIFDSKLQIPPNFTLKSKPFRLIKGILGHSLSASLNFPDTVLDEKIKPIIFDENNSIPEDLNIYYYISFIRNPYVIQNFLIIPNNSLYLSNDELNSIFFKLVHFYPISFIITEDNRFNLNNLTKFRKLEKNETANIDFTNSKRLPDDFPSTQDFMIMPGGDSYVVK